MDEPGAALNARGLGELNQPEFLILTYIVVMLEL